MLGVHDEASGQSPHATVDGLEHVQVLVEDLTDLRFPVGVGRKALGSTMGHRLIDFCRSPFKLEPSDMRIQLVSADGFIEL